jgi:hypothetical protein
MNIAGIWKRYRSEMILLLLVLFTFLFGLFRGLVESFYSAGIYPYIGRVLRLLFGWIPFSIGDILYGIVILYLLFKLVRWFRMWRKKQLNGFAKRRMVRKTLRTIMIIYLLFEWGWGLNYHRLGSAHQLQIAPDEYRKEELLQLTDTLSRKLVVLINSMQPQDSLTWKNFDTVCKASIQSYQLAAKQFPFARYSVVSVKPMVIGSIGGYGGFSGYLNPFTGEAQCNDGLPSFLQPYILCHEIAHQLGYAAEEEANMVGYLACRSHPNPAVRYSVYHDLMMYASRELYYIDTVAYHRVIDSLPLLVKQHHLQAKAYYARFKNPLQILLNKWYDLYLKVNSQEKGLRSYSYITAWLIGYAKKYGWEKI